MDFEINDNLNRFNKLKSEFTFILHNNCKYHGNPRMFDSYIVIDKKYPWIKYIDIKDLKNDDAGISKSPSDKEKESTYPIIIALLYLKSKDKNNTLNDNELLEAYDKVLFAIDCFSSLFSEDKKLIEKRDWVEDEYNALKNKLYGTSTKRVNADNFDDNKKNHCEDVATTICREPFELKKIHVIFNKIISDITEDKNTNEKIKAYIDDAFVFLLLALFRHRTKEKGISLESWLPSIVERVTEKSRILETQDYKKLKDKDCESLIKYLWSKDIQLWFKIINVAKKNKLWDTIYSDIPEFLTSEMNLYRNMSAHSSGNAVDSKWLIRTLRAMVSFTKGLGLANKEWNIETTMLEKRYIYEVYNEADIVVSKYSNIGFSVYEVKQPFPSLKSWKSILRLRDTCDQISSCSIDGIKKRAKAVTSYLFEIREEGIQEKDTAIQQIKKYYSENSILFPFWVSGEAFSNLIEESYPFHPVFFLLTKNMSLDALLEISKECIKTSFRSNDLQPLIMPDAIDFKNKEFHEILVNYYASGKTLSGFNSYKTKSHWLDLLENYFFKVESEDWKHLKTKGETISSEVFSRVCKSVVMLSVDELKATYGSYPSRDWIRLCCCQPGYSICEVEASMNSIADFCLYSLPENPFQLIRPLKYEQQCESFFSHFGFDSGLYHSMETPLKEYKEKCSAIYLEHFKSVHGAEKIDETAEYLSNLFGEMASNNIFKEWKLISYLSSCVPIMWDSYYKRNQRN